MTITSIHLYNCSSVLYFSHSDALFKTYTKSYNLVHQRNISLQIQFFPSNQGNIKNIRVPSKLRNIRNSRLSLVLAIRVLATLQPSVPAPRRRHFADTTFSRSRVGTNRQHINLRLRSTDDSANLNMKFLKNVILNEKVLSPNRKTECIIYFNTPS